MEVINLEGRRVGKSRVAFGLIPVPLMEAFSQQEGTELTEILANHVTDFIQQSSFMDGLSYFIITNLPSEEYEVHNARWLSSLGRTKGYDNVEEDKLFTVFPVILAQSGSQLSFLPVKPLKQLTWSDIDELLKHMDFASVRKLKHWKEKYDLPYKWVMRELELNTNPFYRGEQ